MNSNHPSASQTKREIEQVRWYNSNIVLYTNKQFGTRSRPKERERKGVQLKTVNHTVAHLCIDLQKNIGKILVINPSRSNALSDYSILSEALPLPWTLEIQQSSFRRHLHLVTTQINELSIKEWIISLYHKDQNFFSQEASKEETVEHQEVLIAYPLTSSPL